MSVMRRTQGGSGNLKGATGGLAQLRHAAGLAVLAGDAGPVPEPNLWVLLGARGGGGGLLGGQAGRQQKHPNPVLGLSSSPTAV